MNVAESKTPWWLELAVELVPADAQPSGKKHLTHRPLGMCLESADGHHYEGWVAADCTYTLVLDQDMGRCLVSGGDWNDDDPAVNSGRRAPNRYWLRAGLDWVSTLAGKDPDKDAWLESGTAYEMRLRSDGGLILTSLRP
jgi:hypothetical protein